MQSIIRFVKVLYNILMQQKKRNVYQITFQIELTDESVISTYQDDIRFFHIFENICQWKTNVPSGVPLNKIEVKTFSML